MCTASMTIMQWDRAKKKKKLNINYFRGKHTTIQNTGEKRPNKRKKEYHADSDSELVVPHDNAWSIKHGEDDVRATSDFRPHNESTCMLALTEEPPFVSAWCVAQSLTVFVVSHHGMEANSGRHARVAIVRLRLVN